LIVRPELEEDRAPIGELLRIAFGGNAEADLVETLRRERLVELSLVAIIGGQVVGHILFSELEAEIDGRSIKALALAPMAVVPMRQRQGIGARLIGESLARLGRGGYEAVFVLGHEDYYPQFGFSAELAQKLASPFKGDAFMAMELKPGALQGEKGAVTYPAAFSQRRSGTS